MITNYKVKNLDEKEKKLFENYFPSKFGKLEKFLKSYDDDSIVLDAKIEKFATKEAFKLILKMKMPNNGDLYADEDDHTIPEVIDLAMDKLVRQLRTVKDKEKNRR